MLGKILLKILDPFLGYGFQQSFFFFLNQIVLKGLNIGRGTHPSNSGEKKVIDFIKKRLKGAEKIVIFDVGANVGHYTNLLNDFFSDNVKIFSFEPSRKTFQQLNKNIITKANIKTYNNGFGDKKEKVNLYSDSENSGLASIYKRNLSHFNISMNHKEEIQLDTLDNFSKKNKIEKIHFLKLDIEGNELKALKGAKNLLKRNAIDYIQFEFGGCNIDSRTFFQDFFYLLKDKYNIYRILRDGIFPITEYKEELENFLTTNYLAVKKM